MSEEIEKLLRQPLDKFRFGVEKSNAGFSNIWFLEQRKGKNDLYFGARNGLFSAETNLGSTKVSLHASGICHIKHRSHKADIETNIRWRRPITPSKGAVHVASVHFPTDFIKEWGQLKLKPNKKAFIAGAASSGQSVEFMFFYSMKKEEEISEKLKSVGLPLINIDFSSGEYVYIVVRYIEFIHKLPSIEQWSLPHGAISALEKGGSVDNVSAIYFNKVEDGGCLHVINIQGISFTADDLIDARRTYTDYLKSRDGWYRISALCILTCRAWRSRLSTLIRKISSKE